MENGKWGFEKEWGGRRWCCVVVCGCWGWNGMVIRGGGRCNGVWSELKCREGFSAQGGGCAGLWKVMGSGDGE
jgi:hypothetical protein